jgi:hypothetical protein
MSFTYMLKESTIATLVNFAEMLIETQGHFTFGGKLLG